MSYSFQIKAATKAEAKEKVADAFNTVVATQPVHAKDEAAVIANANAVIDLLADDETKDVAVSCNGYVSWTGTGDPTDALLSSVSIATSVSHAVRAA